MGLKSLFNTQGRASCYSPRVTVPSGVLHSVIWLWVTWGPRTFGSALPPGLSMFHWRIQTWGVKFWIREFVRVPSSCLLHLACPKPTYELGRLYPGLGKAPTYASSALGLNLFCPLWTPQVSLLPGETRAARMGGWRLFPEETLCQDGSI